MGEAARKWVSQHFADERVLQLTVGFYKSLLNRRHGRANRLTSKGKETDRELARR